MSDELPHFGLTHADVMKAFTEQIGNLQQLAAKKEGKDPITDAITIFALSLINVIDRNNEAISRQIAERLQRRQDDGQ